MRRNEAEAVVVFLWCIALAFAGSGLWLGWRQHATSAWPTIEATVLESKIHSTWSIRSDSRHRDSLIHSPRVSYRYDVGGRPYVSDRIGLTTWASGDRAYVERYLEPYRAGRKVRARYDPADPAQSVLDGETTRLPHLFVVVGVLLAAVLHVLRRSGVLRVPRTKSVS